MALHLSAMRRISSLLAALGLWVLAGPSRAADPQAAPAQQAPAGAKAAPGAPRPKVSPYTRFNRGRLGKPASAPRGSSQASHPRHSSRKASTAGAKK
jgi:hypothetical protein